MSWLEERMQEPNSGALKSILNLHKDRPDVQKRIDKAFEILERDKFQMKIPNDIILETLLTILENCGDFEIQISVMKLLLGRDHVFLYKRWFAKTWFEGRPETTKTFLALRQSYDEEDVVNFLSVYNSEPLEFCFVYSIRCFLVSWNTTSLSPPSKGSVFLHLNCGTKTLLVTGVKPVPNYFNSRNVFLLHGTEIRKATVYIKRHNYGSVLQGLSILSIRGHLVVHPDPLLSNENWGKIDEFLRFIAHVSVEIVHEDNHVSVDMNGNIIPDPNWKNFDVESERGNQVDCHHTNHVRQNSFSHVSSSQDDFGRNLVKVETQEVAVQVKEELVDCPPTDIALPVSLFHHGPDDAGNSVVNMSGNSKHTPESTSLESFKIAKPGRKLGRPIKRKSNTQVTCQSGTQEHTSEITPPVSESGSSRMEDSSTPARRSTRSFIKVYGGNLMPGIATKYYSPTPKSGSKRKGSTQTPETVDMTEDNIHQLGQSESCGHSVAENSVEPVVSVTKSETCSSVTPDTKEQKSDDTASKLPEELQTNFSNEDVDEPVIQPNPKPLNMPSLMPSPCATPIQEMSDYVNHAELNIESEGDITTDTGLPALIPVKRCRLAASGPNNFHPTSTLKQVDDKHQPHGDGWKVEIQPRKINSGYESAPISPRAVDSSSDTSFMDTADVLDSAVLLPKGAVEDSSVTGVETFSSKSVPDLKDEHGHTGCDQVSSESLPKYLGGTNKEDSQENSTNTDLNAFADTARKEDPQENSSNTDLNAFADTARGYGFFGSAQDSCVKTPMEGE